MWQAAYRVETSKMALLRRIFTAALLASTLSACGALFGVDFDAAPTGSSEDGGPSAAKQLADDVPAPEPPSAEGTCAETRKLCGGSCVSRVDVRPRPCRPLRGGELRGGMGRLQR
jgi:hypothetical protein